METQKRISLFLTNPTQKNFEKIKDSLLILRLIYTKIEKKSSLVIYLSSDLDNKNFHELLGIYAGLGRDFRGLILEKINKHREAHDVGQLAFSYQRSITSWEKELLLFLMEKAKADFETWERVYKYPQDEITDIAFRKMEELI